MNGQTCTGSGKRESRKAGQGADLRAVWLWCMSVRTASSRTSKMCLMFVISSFISCTSLASAFSTTADFTSPTTWLWVCMRSIYRSAPRPQPQRKSWAPSSLPLPWLGRRVGQGAATESPGNLTGEYCRRWCEIPLALLTFDQIKTEISFTPVWSPGHSNMLRLSVCELLRRYILTYHLWRNG